MKRSIYISLILFVLIFSSCSSHRENIMFATPEDYVNQLQNAAWTMEREYRIQGFDVLKVIVVSRSGEALIDNSELRAGSQSAGSASQGREYRVDNSGMLNMPMIGQVKMEGLTISEAESVIAQEFSTKFDQPFVQVLFNNKRAYLLGAPGGKVVPISEGTTIAEVLAQGGGLGDGRADNIRLVRNSEVLSIDLSDLQDISLVNLNVQPFDIIYIEPVRRPVPEALRDYSPVFSILTALVSVTAIIISSSK